MRRQLWAGAVASLFLVTSGCVGSGADELTSTSEAITVQGTTILEFAPDHFRRGQPTPNAPYLNYWGASDYGFVTRRPTGLLTGWSATRRLVQRISPSGDLLDSMPHTLSPNGTQSTNGADFAWGNNRYYFCSATANLLSILPATGDFVHPEIRTVTSCPQTLLCEAGGCLVLNGANFHVRSPDWSMLGPAMPSNHVGTVTSTTASGTHYLVARNLTNGPFGGPDIGFERVARSGGAPTVLPVPLVAAQRSGAIVASDGTSYLIAYAAGQGAGSRAPGTYFIHVDMTSGSPVYGTTFQLPTLPTAVLRSLVWHNNAYWLLTGSDRPQLTRISRTGEVLDAQPVVPFVSTTPMPPALLLVSQGRLLLVSAPNDQLLAPSNHAVLLDNDGRVAREVDAYHVQDYWRWVGLQSDGTHFLLQAIGDNIESHDELPALWFFHITRDGVITAPTDGRWAPSSSRTNPTTLPRHPYLATFAWNPAVNRYQGWVGNTMGMERIDVTPFGPTTWSTQGTTNYAGGPQPAARINSTLFSIRGADGLTRVSFNFQRLDQYNLPFPNVFNLVESGAHLLVLQVVNGQYQGFRINEAGDLVDGGPVRFPGIGSGSTYLEGPARWVGGTQWAVFGVQTCTSQRCTRPILLFGLDGNVRTLASIDAASLVSTNLVWNGSEIVYLSRQDVQNQPGWAAARHVMANGITLSGTVRPPIDLMATATTGTANDPNLSYGSSLIPGIVPAMAVNNEGTIAVVIGAQDPGRNSIRLVGRLLRPDVYQDAGVGLDVGVRPDVGQDAGPPDVGFPDVGFPDVGRPDTGNDTGPADTGSPVDVPRDNGNVAVDAGFDAGTAPDVLAPIDTGNVVDTGNPTDNGNVAVDTGSAVDTGTPADNGNVAVDAGVDASAPIDTGNVVDTGNPTDNGNVAVDTGNLTDVGVDRPVITDRPDASLPTDTGNAADTGNTADAGPITPPDDGGLCTVQRGVGHRPLHRSAWALGAAALALTLRRRRRAQSQRSSL